MEYMGPRLNCRSTLMHEQWLMVGWVAAWGKELDGKIGTKRSVRKGWTWTSQIGRESEDIYILHEFLSEGIHCCRSSCKSDGQERMSCNIGPWTPRGLLSESVYKVSMAAKMEAMHGLSIVDFPSLMLAWLCHTKYLICQDQRPTWSSGYGPIPGGTSQVSVKMLTSLHPSLHR